jgi:hypothetical protein
MFNHTSAEVLNAIPSLKAISGLTLMCPLSSSERFLRLTPKASAASVGKVLTKSQQAGPE